MIMTQESMPRSVTDKGKATSLVVYILYSRFGLQLSLGTLSLQQQPEPPDCHPDNGIPSEQSTSPASCCTAEREALPRGRVDDISHADHRGTASGWQISAPFHLKALKLGMSKKKGVPEDVAPVWARWGLPHGREWVLGPG